MSLKALGMTFLIYFATYVVGIAAWPLIGWITGHEWMLWMMPIWTILGAMPLLGLQYALGVHDLYYHEDGTPK